MMRPKRTGIYLWAMALVTALLCSGCGYKNKPVPPQQVLPQAVHDLRADVDERGVTLSWGYPRKNVTGGTIEEIDSFELFEAEVPVASYCPSCPVPYRSAVEVPGGVLDPDAGKTAVYEVNDLRPGNLYFFKVRSKSSWWWESEDSNVVSVLWETPPRVPQGLTVTAGDGSISLQWQAVATNRDGKQLSTPVHYQLYRSVDGGESAKLGGVLDKTTYRDTDVENGKMYSYQVQAISVYKNGQVTSPMTDAVKAAPQDKTPPPVPQQVEALRTGEGVKIFWNMVDAPDLAGYRIYRRSAGETTPVKVGEVNLPATLFVDGQAPAGDVYYSVSSIDTQNPANESARSAEVQAE